MAPSSSTNNTFRMASKEADHIAITKEREIYVRLVLSFGRGIDQSIHVMGLLITLNVLTMNMNRLISKIYRLPDIILTVVADEAVQCLNCLTMPLTGVKDSDDFLPSLKRLTDYQLSLEFLGNNRFTIFNETARIVQDILRPAFEDISELAIARAKSIEAGFFDDPSSSESLRAYWNKNFTLTEMEELTEKFEHVSIEAEEKF